MIPRWTPNRGNATVYSRRLGTVVDASVSRVVYDNAPLVPYVGRTGWVLEYPEDENFSSGQVKRKWTPIPTDPLLLVRQLRKDVGCYRARFIPPAHPQIIYPDATTLDDDFKWDYALLRSLYLSSPIYRLEYLDLTSDRRNWKPYSVIPVPWADMEDSSTLYRLTEPGSALFPSEGYL